MTTGVSYPVRNMDTDQKFESVSAAALSIGVTQGALRFAINEHRACKGHWFTYDTDEVMCLCCKAKVEKRKTLGISFGAISLENEVAARVD